MNDLLNINVFSIYTIHQLIINRSLFLFFLTFFAETRIQRNTHAQAECEKPPGRNKTAAASRVGPEGGSISAAEESKMEVAAGPS